MLLTIGCALHRVADRRRCQHLIYSAHRANQEIAHGRCMAKRCCNIDYGAVLEPDVEDSTCFLSEAGDLAVPVRQGNNRAKKRLTCDMIANRLAGVCGGQQPHSVLPWKSRHMILLHSPLSTASAIYSPTR